VNAGDPTWLAALGGVITAITALVVGIMSTRSKVRLDDIATLKGRIDELKESLAAEQDARRRDNAEMQADHDRQIAVYEARIDELVRQVAARDGAITKLDRLVMALRTYVAQLRRNLIANEVEIPDEPEGMNE
jgi:chromosome segregation ATPase